VKSDPNVFRNERIPGGLWGALVGDALGVPVEFQSRSEVQSNLVKDMREFGTHDQPKGNWSDDGALMLCAADSLVHHEFDTEDIGRRFVAWYRDGLWAARGIVFDVGVATAQALTRIDQGARAEVAGGDETFSNGNGSLMRILPVALRFSELSTESMLDRIHRASSITHRHPRSQMACGLYALVVRELLRGRSNEEAFASGLKVFREFYEPDSRWAAELLAFQPMLAGDLPRRPESGIGSSGYVIHTLTASLWCLLTTNDFEQCVLKAVNLGEDTDTTGTVSGGLAGVAYGLRGVPERWRNALPRAAELEALFSKFTAL
jgi:ADP-ribosyl-[dinitrogen reductase] hydrolase